MVMKKNKNPHDRLYEIRHELRYTQTKFARVLDIHTLTYQRYENGTRSMSPISSRLIKLGFNYNWIVTGKGSMYIENRYDIKQDLKIYVKDMVDSYLDTKQMRDKMIIELEDEFQRRAKKLIQEPNRRAENK